MALKVVAAACLSVVLPTALVFLAALMRNLSPQQPLVAIGLAGLAGPAFLTVGITTVWQLSYAISIVPRTVFMIAVFSAGAITWLAAAAWFFLDGFTWS